MSYNLVCFDMDGVIFKDVNFWMRVHEVFETLDEGKALTKELLYTDYDKLVEKVVKELWKGKNAEPYFNLVESVEYLPGVSDIFGYLKNKSLVTAIISASSEDVAKRAQRDYNIDHIFANKLVIENGEVNGEFLWPIGSGDHKKVEIIEN